LNAIDAADDGKADANQPLTEVEIGRTGCLCGLGEPLFQRGRRRVDWGIAEKSPSIPAETRKPIEFAQSEQPFPQFNPQADSPNPTDLATAHGNLLHQSVQLR
jgi:hypothetical protein